MRTKYEQEEKTEQPQSTPEKEAESCEHCGGVDGEHEPIEVMGDGANFEWDVIGHKRCPELND